MPKEFDGAGITVTVTVRHGDGAAHTYQLTPTRLSKAGTYGKFSPDAGCPDMPEWAEIPITLGKPQSTHGKTHKSERAAAKKHAPTPTAAPTPAGTPQTAPITLEAVQKLIAQALKAAK